MRSRMTAVLFALGTVLGYGSGVARLVRAHPGHCAHSFADPADRFRDGHREIRCDDRHADPSPSP